MTTPLKDFFNKDINIGDTVLFPWQNTLTLGSVSKLGKKMVIVVPLSQKTYRRDFRKYGSDCVKVEGPQVTWWMLSNGVSK